MGMRTPLFTLLGGVMEIIRWTAEFYGSCWRDKIRALYENTPDDGVRHSFVILAHADNYEDIGEALESQSLVTIVGFDYDQKAIKVAIKKAPKVYQQLYAELDHVTEPLQRAERDLVAFQARANRILDIAAQLKEELEFLEGRAYRLHTAIKSAVDSHQAKRDEFRKLSTNG
jgi:hypothetical protein